MHAHSLCISFKQCSRCSRPVLIDTRDTEYYTCGQHTTVVWTIIIICTYIEQSTIVAPQDMNACMLLSVMAEVFTHFVIQYKHIEDEGERRENEEERDHAGADPGGEVMGRQLIPPSHALFFITVYFMRFHGS